jgi:hypothetical protein
LAAAAAISGRTFDFARRRIQSPKAASMPSDFPKRLQRASRAASLSRAWLHSAQTRLRALGM